MAPNMNTTQQQTTSSSPAVESSPRLGVLKTYKLYIAGKFPRTESGRFYKLESPTGEAIANMCQASRKDFREAVVAARAAQGKWAAATAYNRGQVLYRIAEMLEGRADQFVNELVQMGAAPADAKTEVACAIDRLVYYAGWCDKYQQVFSSVNPVASSHFNFSLPEPTGVVSVIAPQDSALSGLVSVIAPLIAAGNTAVVLGPQNKALCTITFAEVLHTSDLPAGVVNLLTGDPAELLEHFASHMDVNAIVYCGDAPADIEKLRTLAADNLKRAVIRSRTDWQTDDAQSPYDILDTTELKTTWHPIGI